MEDLGLSPAFWKGKRVLVTGHTGFKGGWLALWLDRLGAEVSGYALAPATRPDLFTVLDVASLVRSEFGDVRDLEHLRRFATDVDPEIIVHMAARSLVRASYEDPAGTYATNVMGTVNVLEAARTCRSLEAIVNVTTDKCYEARERANGYREDDPMGGFDPYSSSKGCAELVTSAYRRSFFTGDACAALASARAGNVVGGGDWAADRLVPDVMRSFAKAEPADIRNPASVRPWQHVLEPLHGYLLLAERLCGEPDLAGGWNFGPHEADALPVAWLADRLAELWGDGASWQNLSERAPRREATSLRLDIGKATSRLGWQPRLDLGSALRWTVEWYRCFHEGGDVRALTERQIANFESARTSV